MYHHAKNFQASLGYSSEQTSEVDTITFHVLQRREMKHREIINSPEVTPPPGAAEISGQAIQLQGLCGQTAASERCSRPGEHGSAFSPSKIFNTWANSLKPKNTMHHYHPIL